MADDLRERFLWFVQSMVVVAGITLGVGLAVHLSETSPTLANRAFFTGFVVLMATPVVRTLIALAERIRRRDLLTVTVTVIVLLELSVAMWYATTRV